jgi:hypothetical protein
MKLEDLQPNAAVRGLLTDGTATVVIVQWHGADALTLIFRDPAGRVAEVARRGVSAARVRCSAFRKHIDPDGPADGQAGLFVLGVEPLPHQFTAVNATSLPAGGRPGRQQNDHRWGSHSAFIDASMRIRQG